MASYSERELREAIEGLAEAARTQMGPYAHGTMVGGSAPSYTPTPLGDHAPMMVHLKLQEARVWQREVERQRDIMEADEG